MMIINHIPKWAQQDVRAFQEKGNWSRPGSVFWEMDEENSRVAFQDYHDGFEQAAGHDEKATDKLFNQPGAVKFSYQNFDIDVRYQGSAENGEFAGIAYPEGIEMVVYGKSDGKTASFMTLSRAALEPLYIETNQVDFKTWLGTKQFWQGP